ncbi:DUF1454 family protein [Serratia microhaemolytica]|uniref:DUF1454 family protein n=1 Tax=Serratia microhaemolytica TaxID=2675110 RepID=UPI000FDF14A6|nr:DUF1454 family protein [Serratia microhaemolytica]
MQKIVIAVACYFVFNLWFALHSVFAAQHDTLALSAERLTAPYLLAEAPTFSFTVAEFRESYNRDNPTLPIGEFRIVASERADPPSLLRAASRIRADLYASTALERGSGKIKTIQLTHLLSANSTNAQSAAIQYMAALIRQFETVLTIEQSIEKVNELLRQVEASHFYLQSNGAIRYVMVLSEQEPKSVTLAVEPVRLVLAE